jgi:UDP-glucose 4-epimerase
MKKPILITGGCGFVGRHLAKKLLEQDNSLWVVDDLSTGKHPDKWLDSKWPDKVTFIKEDALVFFNDLIEKRSKIDVPDFRDVYHLASIVGGRALIDGDPLLVAKDLAIDASMFLWATRFPEKIERLMYASSSAAYPINLQTKDKALALKEEHINFGNQLGQPDMTYGWSKLSGEYLATLAHKKYNLHVACVRPFSGYGEDQDPSYPVPAIALRVARHESPIEVWGNGEQGRDFVHIDDCVDAMMIILEKVNDGRGINIGSGKLTSFNQLINKMCEIEGHKAEIKPLLDKPVGVASRYADTTILNNDIGWRPSTSIEEGVKMVLGHAHKRINKETEL